MRWISERSMFHSLFMLILLPKAGADLDFGLLLMFSSQEILSTLLDIVVMEAQSGRATLRDAENV